ncbi:hypothetical protein CXZ10_05960 [Pleomorphomonas diazotrophica]|uniref:Uncharacterized protein n=1 Tax=Pleomorphomonas diazotrophica TaxID=1166257 RepID=A0A1I4Q7R5_9HYPH|nr:hypothetical protein [Pleomorphomonas diazotrophica]PKR90889.1 hypothetical protein CXZ10_05960 [Pleomorphomonas diazotrophica]SFM35846.1 hypothetical protein SAMN05192571_101119 [Pleomorphomonas diazotrophica]
MQPQRIEFNLSDDVYGRSTKLVFQRLYDGKMGWTITRDAISQLDEPQTVSLLTDTQLKEIGAIAEQFGRKGA